ncbi:hypothetical protein BJ170DRAFT_685070 [Xylariales sp. AK1849]|nr:hypothetical protein BJ170DRAFT_685070 [Xylariales sp. AK1849]
MKSLGFIAVLSAFSFVAAVPAPAPAAAAADINAVDTVPLGYKREVATVPLGYKRSNDDEGHKREVTPLGYFHLSLLK